LNILHVHMQFKIICKGYGHKWCDSRNHILREMCALSICAPSILRLFRHRIVYFIWCKKKEKFVKKMVYYVKYYMKQKSVWPLKEHQFYVAFKKTNKNKIYLLLLSINKNLESHIVKQEKNIFKGNESLLIFSKYVRNILIRDNCFWSKIFTVKMCTILMKNYFILENQNSIRNFSHIYSCILWFRTDNKKSQGDKDKINFKNKKY